MTTTAAVGAGSFVDSSTSKSLKAAVKKLPVVPAVYRGVRNVFQGVGFAREYRTFKRACDAAWGASPRFPMRWGERWACFYDKDAITFEPHYLYHPAWAARVLAKTRPAKHVDVSSTTSFVATVSAFVPIDYYEWRPVDLKLSDLTAAHANLLDLPFPDNSIASLSCMHTIEHVGMGRYGDPVDPDGDLVAIRELKRVLAPGGDLLFVVPMGKPRIRFNAARTYSYDQIREYFSDLEVVEFALILEDATGIVYGASKELADTQSEGCGCFWFRKPR